MPIDFSDQVYLPSHDVFARIIIVNPIKSQPGVPAYTARGIYDTVSVDVIGVDGSIISDQRTIVDVRDKEFIVVPKQHDIITIPADGTLPDLGDWEVADQNINGGGETTLTLRRVVAKKP